MAQRGSRAVYGKWLLGTPHGPFPTNCSAASVKCSWHAGSQMPLQAQAIAGAGPRTEKPSDSPPMCRPHAMAYCSAALHSGPAFGFETDAPVPDCTDQSRPWQGAAVARQRAVWERALELRILLQRCLAASHQLPRPEVLILARRPALQSRRFELSMLSTNGVNRCN